MDIYHIWCNLRPGEGDLAFSEAVAAYLDHLKAEGVVAGWRLTRRKLGFGPPGLGEFHIAIEVRDLAQLDAAFGRVATREPGIEALHAPVYRAACDVTFALYRDFPDPGRVPAG